MFSISIIVWVAVYIGLELIIEADDDESVGELDEAVGITGLLLCSLPYAPLAWLGVTILTGWLIPGPADLDGDFSVSTPPMASSGFGLVRISGAHRGSDQHHPYGDDGYLGKSLRYDSWDGRINHHKLDDRRGYCGTVFVGNACQESKA